MSNTLPPCRREETVLCDPHAAAVKKPKTPPKRAASADPAESCEQRTMSEKQFLRDHTMYSAISSWLFAIAGATNIGVLCAFSSKLLSAVESGTPILKSAKPEVKAVLGNKKYNIIALSMMAFGGVCMAVSNWLESKKVVTEWQLGAGKLQRKAAGADRHQAHEEQASTNDTADTSPKPKEWAASVQPENADTVGLAAARR